MVALARTGDAEHLRQVLSSELEKVLNKYAEGGHDLAIDQKKESAVGVRDSKAVNKEVPVGRVEDWRGDP